MITPAYARTMAAYNTEMNRRLYAAAARLPDADRRTDQGAFWTSLHGTLSHLLWADFQWMSRFANWPPPGVPLKQSATFVTGFDDLATRRIQADAGLEAWAAQLDPAWLAADQTWWSGASNREMRAPRTILVTHLFNHQTHHRGQAHALLTRAGQDPGATDLPFIIPH